MPIKFVRIPLDFFSDVIVWPSQGTEFLTAKIMCNVSALIRRLLIVVVVLVSLALSLKTIALPGNQYDAYAVIGHLETCLQRPVFFTLQVARQLSTDELPACNKDALAPWLESRGLKAFSEDSVVLIDDPDRYLHHERLYAWKNLKLDVSVRRTSKDEIASQEPDNPGDYKFVAIRRSLNDEELRQAGDWITKNVPMPPISSPMVETGCYACPSVPPDTAIIKLEIRLEAVKFSSDGVERIVGVIGTKDTSQIVVGSVAQGRFHLEWISPLLDPELQTLQYRDVNADGISEIWSLSVYGSSEMPWELSIFDLKGKELTREAGDCQWPLSVLQPVNAKESPLPTVCPIVGLPTIDHFLEADGSVSLLANRDFRGNEEKPRRYKFVAGRYVPDRKPR
jgi:hypothetical protein